MMISFGDPSGVLTPWADLPRSSWRPRRCCFSFIALPGFAGEGARNRCRSARDAAGAAGKGVGLQGGLSPGVRLPRRASARPCSILVRMISTGRLWGDL